MKRTTYKKLSKSRIHLKKYEKIKVSRNSRRKNKMENKYVTK